MNENEIDLASSAFTCWMYCINDSHLKYFINMLMLLFQIKRPASSIPRQASRSPASDTKQSQRSLRDSAMRYTESRSQRWNGISQGRTGNQNCRGHFDSIVAYVRYFDNLLYLKSQLSAVHFYTFLYIHYTP